LLRPCHRLFACPLHATIAMGVAVLASLACVGAMMPPPGSHGSPASAFSPGHASLAAPPILQAAEHPLPVNVSSRNLQLPRAPRQRSERPTSGAIDAEAITATEIFDALGADTHGSFVTDGVRACPLSGHPLSLLRPPSLLAG
jgi:hypothetical protein